MNPVYGKSPLCCLTSGPQRTKAGCGNQQFFRPANLQDFVDILRPAGKYLLYDEERFITGNLSAMLCQSSCRFRLRLIDCLDSWDVSWGTEFLILMGVPLHRMSTSSCSQRATLLQTMKTCLWKLCLQHFSRFESKELSKMGGNCIHLRAAAVAIIMALKALDPALLQRYLDRL